MNIIGVELHTPTRGDLKVMALLSVVYISAALVVDQLGLVDPIIIAGALVGLESEALAAACGCTIKKDGLRGAILTNCFFLVLTGLCVGVIYLIKFF